MDSKKLDDLEKEQGIVDVDGNKSGAEMDWILPVDLQNPLGSFLYRDFPLHFYPKEKATKKKRS